MAKKTTVRFVDDVDGSEAERTLLLVDPLGNAREVDLSQAHLDEYEDAIAKFWDAGRPAGKVKAGSKTATVTAPRLRTDRELNQAMRGWARGNGWPQIADRGRVPADVIEAYQRVHP